MQFHGEDEDLDNHWKKKKIKCFEINCPLSAYGIDIVNNRCVDVNLLKLVVGMLMMEFVKKKHANNVRISNA